MKLYRPATYPEAEKLEGILKPSMSRAFLAPHHIEAYQPLHLEIGSNAIARSSMQWILPFGYSSFLVFFHCCSSCTIHSCLTVIFTSLMLVLVTLSRPLDTALHPSSMNLQIWIQWVLTLASSTNSSYPNISNYPARVAPPPILLSQIPIPLPRCQTRSWARFW